MCTGRKNVNVSFLFFSAKCNVIGPNFATINFRVARNIRAKYLEVYSRGEAKKGEKRFSVHIHRYQVLIYSAFRVIYAADCTEIEL